MALAKKLVLTPRKRASAGAPGATPSQKVDVMAQKRQAGTPGTAPPRPKPGASQTKKAGVLSQSVTRPTGAANGLLTTGEHPERDAYMKRTGKTKDPLEAAGGKVQRSFVNTTAGPRKGMTALEILKGGAKFHVYYTPKGRRQVFKVPARGTPRVTASAPQIRSS
jgi:hypothetical protein